MTIVSVGILFTEILDMKILKITASVIKPVKAVTVRSRNVNKPDDLHYNVKFGSMGSDLWVYSMGVDRKLFKPKDAGDVLELTDDNYVLIPIKNNGDAIKDRKGNDIYYITVDHTEDHRKDTIALWEIPSRNYQNVEYTADGEVRVLGYGLTGKTRGSIKYISPAPVLEVMGDCVLKWTGIDKNNKEVSQTITYTSDGKWEIGLIKVGEENE